jgi:hypothetical protein
MPPRASALFTMLDVALDYPGPVAVWPIGSAEHPVGVRWLASDAQRLLDAG